MEQFAILISTLVQSRTQAQIFHWQAQGVGSDAAHRALGDYYDGIVDLVDKLVESTQGRHGITRGYQMSGTIKEDANYVMYFEALAKFVETIRQQVYQDSYIQNQIDTIVELIEHTKYRLTNLH